MFIRTQDKWKFGPGDSVEIFELFNFHVSNNDGNDNIL